MPSLHRILAACAVLTSALLAGCGGDGAGATGGTPTGSTGPSTSGVAVIELTTSSPTLVSDGASTVTITAFAKDGGNRAIANQPIEFSTTDRGAALQVSGALTDANGTATAKLSISDPTNRTIAVKAVSGVLSKSIDVAVTGTVVTLNGPGSVVLNAATDYAISLRDGGGKGLAGKALTVSSAAGNTVTPATVTTDAAGQARVTLTATKGGTDTLTVSGLGASASLSVGVAASQLVFAAPSAGQELVVGASNPIQVRFVQDGQPVTGQSVEIFATRGTVTGSPATTDATGTATATISATTAGISTITAKVGGILASQRVEFVSKTPAKLSLQASPANVGINLTPSGTNASKLIAVVRDAADNPVKGQTVAFRAVTDPSNGRIEPAVATTDSAGVASVAFYPGANTTGNNAIVVEASVPGAASVKGSATLTASRQELVVRIGTGNSISEKDAATYSMPWTAVVTDSSGNPVVGASVQAAVVGVWFGKGQYYAGLRKWTPGGEFDGLPVYWCPSEDVNGNLRLDPGEDVNGDGMLTPAGVAATRVTSTDGRTDATGFAGIAVEYPQQYGNWVQVELRVTITTIAGTEGVARQVFTLPVLDADVDLDKSPPGGRVSSFGLIGSCSTAR